MPCFLIIARPCFLFSSLNEIDDSLGSWAPVMFAFTRRAVQPNPDIVNPMRCQNGLVPNAVAEGSVLQARQLAGEPRVDTESRLLDACKPMYTFMTVIYETVHGHMLTCIISFS